MGEFARMLIVLGAVLIAAGLLLLAVWKFSCFVFCSHSGLSGIVFELKRLKATTIPDKPE